MSDERQSTSQAAGALIDSALRLSASVAQVVAEAATGKPQSHREGDTPLQAIVRHGTTAASGIVSTVASAASAARSNGAAPDDPAAAPAQPLPSISAGSTLRVPLSVDNPTADPMRDLTPTLTELTHADVSDPSGWQVTFDPEVLTVEPQDFEKLVVRVTVPEDAGQGTAQATFSLGPEAAPVTLRFEVV